MRSSPTRVVLVSSASTIGQRNSDDDFAAILTEAGAEVTVVRPRLPRVAFPSLSITDMVQAWYLWRALRRSAAREAAELIVFATTTATLLQPRRLLRRSALRFDTLACENRPGLDGTLARALERRALRHVPVLLPMSSVRDPGLARERFLGRAELVTPMPPPLPARASAQARDATAPLRVVCYAANARKKGLDVIVAAWSLVQAPPGRGAELTVTGIDEPSARRFLATRGVEPGEGVSFLGRLDRERYAEHLAGADVFVAASRYEDYGMAQLEALEAGVPVVSTPSAGPFEAGGLLRAVAPAFLASGASPAELAETLSGVLSMDADARRSVVTAVRAQLEPYRWPTIVARVRHELLPRYAATGGP